MTRAVSATRSIAWTRPTNSEVSVIAVCSARTTPTDGGPLGAWAWATDATNSEIAKAKISRQTHHEGPQVSRLARRHAHVKGSPGFRNRTSFVVRRHSRGLATISKL